jgi:hypothetical protein
MATIYVKREITQRQMSDMGSGFGEYTFSEPVDLASFLHYYKKNSKAWGTVTILNWQGETVRKFDFNTYHGDTPQFYVNLDGWYEKCKVKSAEFSYCFMSEDLTIRLEKYNV